MSTPLDYHTAGWLVGILEGEGSFDLAKGRYPRIRLGMTDADVVRKAAGLMGSTVYTEFRYPHKPMFRTEVWGARAADLMENLLPWMGARRSARVAEVLGEYRRQSSHVA